MCLVCLVCLTGPMVPPDPALQAGTGATVRRLAKTGEPLRVSGFRRPEW